MRPALYKIKQAEENGWDFRGKSKLIKFAPPKGPYNLQWADRLDQPAEEFAAGSEERKSVKALVA
jgi:hypothetical protein